MDKQLNRMNLQVMLIIPCRRVLYLKFLSMHTLKPWLLISAGIIFLCACNNASETKETKDTSMGTRDTVSTLIGDTMKLLIDTLEFKSDSSAYINVATGSKVNITAIKDIDQLAPLFKGKGPIYYAKNSDSTGWLFNNMDREMVMIKQNDSGFSFPKESLKQLNRERDSIARISNTIKERDIHLRNLNEKKLDALPRTGILGYSFFKKMKQNETRDIYVYVTINNPKSEVIGDLKDLNQDYIPVRRGDTASIYTQNILLYRYLDVKLIDPDHDFDVVQVHDSGRQLIDTIEGNHWQWSITPRTYKKQAQLILKVTAEKPDGTKDQFKSKDISIEITLEYGVFRRIWTWLMDHPERFLILLIIPFIGWIGKELYNAMKNAIKKRKSN